MSGPVWVIGPISIWVVRDVWDVLFVAGFMSLLPLSPLLVATTCRFSWLAVSASSKFGFPCQVQVQAQVEVQNGHARRLPARQLQQATTRILVKTEALDVITYPAAPQEGGSVNLHPFSIQHPASSRTKTKEGGCRTDDVGSGRLLEALQRPQLPCKEGKKGVRRVTSNPSVPSTPTPSNDTTLIHPTSITTSIPPHPIPSHRSSLTAPRDPLRRFARESTTGGGRGAMASGPLGGPGGTLSKLQYCTWTLDGHLRLTIVLFDDQKEFDGTERPSGRILE
ncbi:hypothetical protein BKA56DRAFT_613594 [Ilyonectria sp. MPI-CAGE-AT-0026]|nr:hypothetical protein BKA56DRAFT_613594 [Ilyonectria sp. MPI-CAGE-AT-0026]